MAGYSTAGQARKLGLRPGQRLSLDRPPPGWSLQDPPALVVVPVRSPESVDVLIAFFTAAADLPQRVRALAQRVFPGGSLWLAWPRRAGGHQSDLTDGVVRSEALKHGLVDVKVAAIDTDWSGLRFVWRVANRH